MKRVQAWIGKFFSGNPNNSEREGEQCFLYTMSHLFELSLVIVVMFVSLIFLVPLEKVLQTLCETVATVAFVHCVDTVRIMSGRISTFAEYMKQAYESGCPRLANCYSKLLHNTKIDRNWFTLFTVMNAVLWFTVSVCYASFLAKTSVSHHEPASAIHASAETGSEASKGSGAADTNPDKGRHSTTWDERIRQIFGSTTFLHLWVGFSAMLGLMISVAKISAVSIHPHELSVRWLMEQILDEQAANAAAFGTNGTNVGAPAMSGRTSSGQ